MRMATFVIFFPTLLFLFCYGWLVWYGMRFYEDELIVTSEIDEFENRPPILDFNHLHVLD